MSNTKIKLVLKKKNSNQSNEESNNQSNIELNQKCSICEELFNNEILLDNHIKQFHKKHTFIEVCAGAGGLSNGLIKSGFIPLLLNDNNKDCCKTLEKNHNDLIINGGLKIVFDSLTKIDLKEYIGKVDLLTGGIPCFIAGTKVLTNEGYKLIEDVTIENTLLTHTGTFQSIINLQHKQYTGNVFKFKIKYHPELISCTEEHPFYIREKKYIRKNNKSIYNYGEPIWKKANEITKNDYFGMVINNKSIEDFLLTCDFN